MARSSHEVETLGRGPQSEKQELYLKVQTLLLPRFMNSKVYDMGRVKCRSNERELRNIAPIVVHEMVLVHTGC